MTGSIRDVTLSGTGLGQLPLRDQPANVGLASAMDHLVVMGTEPLFDGCSGVEPNVSTQLLIGRDPASRVGTNVQAESDERADSLVGVVAGQGAAEMTPHDPPDRQRDGQVQPDDGQGPIE